MTTTLDHTTAESMEARGFSGSAPRTSSPLSARDALLVAGALAYTVIVIGGRVLRGA